jgi:hypothetical protein
MISRAMRKEAGITGIWINSISIPNSLIQLVSLPFERISMMKYRILFVLMLAVLLTSIPLLIVSAKTVVVRVRADVEWVASGIYVEEGVTYPISTHGIAWTGSPSLYPNSISGPEGQSWPCSGNYPVLPCNLDGAPYGALIGQVDGEPFLIGGLSSFTAPATGWLLLGVNDDLIYHDDNQAGFTVQFK